MNSVLVPSLGELRVSERAAAKMEEVKSREPGFHLAGRWGHPQPRRRWKEGREMDQLSGISGGDAGLLFGGACADGVSDG